MKVIIAGSRTIIDYHHVFDAIQQSGYEITEVVSGGAVGVDRLGEQWARDHNVPVVRFLPDWKRFGKPAGHFRNADMASYGDALIAIWNGESPGTKNMIESMRRFKKPFYPHKVIAPIVVDLSMFVDLE